MNGGTIRKAHYRPVLITMGIDSMGSTMALLAGRRQSGQRNTKMVFEPCDFTFNSPNSFYEDYHRKN